jgi:hypothetical protein
LKKKNKQYKKEIMENEENHMNIELSEEIALGTYSNLAIITHSPAEVVCDFVQIMPGMPKGKVRSRVLMTPQNAKRFLQALTDNIQKYEQNFGVIDDPQAGFPPMNFGTPNTMA